MMRSKTTTSFQKTYDECYLICSTAVYFEGQGNEAEALRSWRSALDQIYYHNAYRVPANFRPKSETEKALCDSLRGMEIQCKERVDLLEALKQSRQESQTTSDGASSSASFGKVFKASTPKASFETERNQAGWIGGGTIPAISPMDVPRPGPPLPARPSISSLPRNLSERAVVGRTGSTHSIPQLSATSSRDVSGSSTTLAPPVHGKKTSRSPSPDKGRPMRTTLRSAGSGSEMKSTLRTASRPTGTSKPEPNKAATLAWNSMARRDKLGRSHPEMQGSSPSLGESSRHNDVSANALPTRRSQEVHWDSKTRRLVNGAAKSTEDILDKSPLVDTTASNSYPFPSEEETMPPRRTPPPVPVHKPSYPTYMKEYPETTAKRNEQQQLPIRRRSPARPKVPGEANGSSSDKLAARTSEAPNPRTSAKSSSRPKVSRKPVQTEEPILVDPTTPPSESEESDAPGKEVEDAWAKKVAEIMKNLPKGVDEGAAKQIFNEIVVQGDEVHWDDVAGLEIAKNALKEAVVYPFLRPDLFMGLREPARGMLLFGPPGTGKTMLARAVATESRSTFFSISASSLTSKYLGESEKLVRALFQLAKALAPSIIFVDEIDSLLSARSGSGEHEATRRIKTEFLIQWSDLQRAAAGREQTQKEKERGDASRVLVLAATNLPWAIDEAARRRFVRRQYIPLPEDYTRAVQLKTLLGHQKHGLRASDLEELVRLTEGFSGSDITALAKDAAMGPLRSLGEALLHMSMDQIRPIQVEDFHKSLVNIRPSVSKQGLKEFEDWAKEFGERGG